MTKARLETFSDGVIAILITIMVLELAKPEAATWHALFLAAQHHIAMYALSFVMLGIYWNNHHHLFHIVERVSGAVLWTNLHLLFWLSLIPFMTAWIGDTGLLPVPTAAYGIVLLLSAVAYYIMTLALVAANGPKSRVAQALGRDVKGKISVVIYAVALPLAVAWPPGAFALYTIVAMVWFVPDRRMERN
jgi:uncharacterized membrane protein